MADGSEALFVGNREYSEKISKKGNKFGIVTLLDLHGNIELMLFSDKLTQLQKKFNLEEPIAFKVKIAKSDSFTRVSVMKIESIREAKKEKIEIIKERDVNPTPIFIYVDMGSGVELIERLHSLAEEYRGYSPLKLILKSDRESILIESRFRVSDMIMGEVEKLGLKSIRPSS